MGGTDWGDRGGGIVWGYLGVFYKFLTFLGVAAGAFFFRPKTRFWIFGKTIDFYKLLTVLGVAAGAFFSAKNPFFDF